MVKDNIERAQRGVIIAMISITTKSKKKKEKSVHLAGSNNPFFDAAVKRLSIAH
jgi:hypothetical protein